MDAEEVLSPLLNMGYIEDSDDLSDVGISIDLVATKLIQARIVESKFMRSASTLSEVLAVFVRRSDLHEDVHQAAIRLEDCISQSNYGYYSEEVVAEAEEARDTICSSLEQWLETKLEPDDVEADDG